MAESYIITIKFAPTNQSLKDTEKKLNSTFDRVVKRFKNGFGKAWKGLRIGSGIAAMGTALAALLNPLAQLNDSINATLNKAGNIKDRAQAAGTDIQSYLALQGYAASKGVNEETFNMMMSRMQTLLGQAKAGENNALSAYKNETDMGRVFYNVMNNIAKVSQQDRAQGAALASAVFGQRAVAQLGPLVTEGFLQEDLNKLLSGVNLNKAAASVMTLDRRGDQQAALQFKREIDDLIQKGEVITPDIINMQDANARSANKLENEQIKSYADIASIDARLKDLQSKLYDFLLKMEPVLNWVQTGLETSLNGLGMLPQFVTDTKDFFEIMKARFNRLMDSLPRWLGGK